MKKRPYKIGFVADPLENFNPEAETTSFIIAECQRRGWESHHIELKNLVLKNETPHALTKQVQLKKQNGKFSYTVKNSKLENLAHFDALFLRKDPPLDLNFLDHLTILELLVEHKPLLINHPTWVKHANEKLFTFHFKDLAPKTIVTQNSKLIAEFVKKQKVAILKPLNLSGGRGIVRVKGDDPSLNSLIEILTENENRFIMAQEFIPDATKGDKRILILDGEVLGSFLRVPPKKDFRGNLHSGAKLVKTKMTKREKDIVVQIAPRLSELGLYFVGIDIIGPYVTEINSTSPMGIREINLTDNTQIEKKMGDWLEAKLAKRS